MNNDIMTIIIAFVGAIVITVVFGLVLAFPIQWCWNSTIVAIWDLPEITWGQAWCLSFLSSMFIKSTLSPKK